jgi:hypothetical protein
MKRAYIVILFALLFSCSDELERLPPAEVRAAEALQELKDKLTAPSNGWLLEYQPTAESGVFNMIIRFGEDDIANIKSDLPVNNGQFIEQNISYRLDNGLALELVFETYGAFHYLFELDQASFGGEFEFIYETESNGNLLFSSKTDFSSPTLITLRPAQASDIESFSLEEAENINTYDSFTPQIFGGLAPIQQVVFSDRSTSLFWFIDVRRRNLTADFISIGTTEAAVIASSEKLKLNISTAYKYSDGKIVLLQPLEFSFNGSNYEISEIALNNLSSYDTEACAGNTVQFPSYSGSINGLGNVTINKSFLNFEGLQFKPQASNPYTVNSIFAFDESGNSLSDIGILADKFPTASAIALNYGFDSTEEPANAFGLYLEGENGENLTYLREFQVVSQVGNRLELQFLDNFYFSDTPQGTAQEDLTTFTELLFEGGSVYLFDLPIDGIKVFWFYNPCNSYEFVLVQ